MHYVLLTVGVGKHAEKLWCAVTCLGKVPLILSHDWLKKHNPDIDWTTGDVDESTLEEAQKLVPHEYWDYLDVFLKGFPTKEGLINPPFGR